jgi:hypothetical protein
MRKHLHLIIGALWALPSLLFTGYCVVQIVCMHGGAL